MSSKPVGIAVVGLGFGSHIANQIASGEAGRWLRLVAVSDLDPKRACEGARRFGVPAITWKEALSGGGIEAVGLFTRPAGRAALVREAVEAGRHVLTTKPFESDPDAAVRVLRRATDLRRVVHTNSPGPRPSPDLRCIRLWQRTKGLGRIVALRGEAWGSYHEGADGSWYDDPALCPAAPLFRLGIYLVNDIVALAGLPEAVQVFQSRMRTGRPTPDNATLHLTFRGGVSATVFASLCVGDGQPYKNALTVNFENGTAYRNVGPPGALRPPIRSELALVRAGKGGRTRVSRTLLTSLSGDYDWRAFAGAVRGTGGHPKAPARTLVAGLRVIEAMTESARTGRLVPVSPDDLGPS